MLSLAACNAGGDHSAVSDSTDGESSVSAATSPSELLPIGVPVRLLIGARDTIVAPASNERFAAQARAQGDDVELEVMEGAGHFDVVMPAGPASERVQGAIRELLRPGS